MVESTTKRLKDMKENSKSRTWCKNHSLMFSGPTQVGIKKIEVTEKMKADFEQKAHHPYLQSH